MSETIDLALLGRYLDGSASREERAAVEAWIGSDPERREAIAALQSAWNEDASRLDAPYDVDAGWQRLRFARGPRRAAAGSRATRRALAAAAVVATLLAAPVWWLVENQPLGQGEATIALQEHVTARGQRDVIHLPDGTVVTLNGESRLEVAAGFDRRPLIGQRPRRVTLTGEAQFDVAHDARRPFVVRTERSRVQVLGTRFGVRAYAEALADRISLAEGAVGLRPAAERSRTGMRLEPGEVASVTAAGVRVVPGASVSDELAWVDGWLVLENLPLAEAARRLERWYDLEVRVLDPTLLHRPVTGSYRDEPVAEVLTLVTAAIGARFDRDGRMVTIYGADTAPPSGTP